MSSIRRKLSFANVCSFVALLIALGTGSAYAANTIFSTDIVDGEVKTADLANNAVRTSKVVNEGLTGADIKDKSGVDTCVSTVRIGDLCFRADLARQWDQAVGHCANLGLRLPTLAEAMSLALGNDLPNVDQNAQFWTDEHYATFAVWSVNDAGGRLGVDEADTEVTVCVTTPTN